MAGGSATVGLAMIDDRPPPLLPSLLLLDVPGLPLDSVAECDDRLAALPSLESGVARTDAPKELIVGTALLVVHERCVLVLARGRSSPREYGSPGRYLA